MNSNPTSSPVPAGESLKFRFAAAPDPFLLSLALVKTVLMMAVSVFGGYGYFRDEFYYLACSEHLDWGYVDQPPLSIAILAVSRLILGDSLVGLRLLPAVVGGITVYFTGLMAKELGGKRFAQALAAIAVIVAPVSLAMDSIYSMNTFTALAWAVAGYLLIRILKNASVRYWILLGIVLGLGLMNKIDILWLGAGIFTGILLTPSRTLLKTRWPWLAGGIAFLLFLPYIIWNISHDLAHLEFIRNATSEKYSLLNPIDFLMNQIPLQNPISLPIWLAGLWFFFASPRGKIFRPLGYVYVTAFVILVLNYQSKAEYLSPAYSLLFAGGAVMIDSIADKRAWKWLRPAAVVLPVLSGVMLAPLVIAVLPVESYIEYAEMLGVAPSTSENKRLEKLPQFYADRFGWEELTATVLSIYKSLPPEEQEHTAIYTQNYGEAGAISFFGKRFGLPPAVSGHNSYFLWGPGPIDTNTVLIIVGGRRENHQEAFKDVEQAGQTQCTYCMPYENNRPIFVGRKLKKPIEEIWPLTKSYN